jgi:hypothetical protein
VRPARAHLERLVEWVLPVAFELGCASYLSIPSANAAERQIARHEAGASLEEIFAEQIRLTEPAASLAMPPSGRAGLARASVGNDPSTQDDAETDAP